MERADTPWLLWRVGQRVRLRPLAWIYCVKEAWTWKYTVVELQTWKYMETGNLWKLRERYGHVIKRGFKL